MRRGGRGLRQLRRRRRLLGLIALLGGCGPSRAELAHDAAQAALHDDALAACARMAPLDADVCRVDAAARFGRLEVGDCDAVNDPTWAGECRFQYAERLARAGRAAEAFAACTTTPFSRECDYHLLREVVRAAPEVPLADAATALDPWRDLPGLRDAPRLYWKAWFRERRRAGAEVDPAACPEPACLEGAKQSYFENLRGLHRADRAAFCAAVPESVPGWASTETTAAWKAAWAADTCARDAADGVAPAPAPSPPGGAPAIPPPR